MALGEFELIGRYFARSGTQRRDTVVGVGDDAALLNPPPQTPLLTSWATVCPESSSNGATLAADLIQACLAKLPHEAKPCWLVLSLTLPGAEEPWLAAFAQQLDALCRQHEIQLVGGDTTGGRSYIELHCLALAAS